MQTVADRIIAFNKNLRFPAPLPDGIHVMNPFRDKKVLEASSRFYKKYYADANPRFLILGINPGRFGAGLTGVPFTDPKRFREIMGPGLYEGESAHEPSSVFVYDMISAYGGVEAFYGKFYINSLSPLGFTSEKNGKEVNYNYYDSKALTEAARPFIIESIRKQRDFAVNREVCFCLGIGKNANFLKKLNEEHSFFDRIVPLEHPRYVIQYKTKQKRTYIEKYLAAFAAEA